MVTLAIANIALAIVAARVSSPGGPWLWNWDLPKIDFPFAALFHDALLQGHLASGMTTSGSDFRCTPRVKSVRSIRQLADLPASSADRARCVARASPSVRRARGRPPRGTAFGFKERSIVAAAVPPFSVGRSLRSSSGPPCRGLRRLPVGPASSHSPPDAHGARPRVGGPGVGHTGTDRSSQHVAADRLVGGRHHGDDHPRRATAARVVEFAIVGVAVGAVQLVPTLLLTTLSVRSAGLTLDDLFTSSATPFDPLLLGFSGAFAHWTGSSLDVANTWYPDGGFALLEAGAYVGLPAIALAAVGITSRRSATIRRPCSRHARAIPSSLPCDRRCGPISRFWMASGLRLFLPRRGARPRRRGRELVWPALDGPGRSCDEQRWRSASSWRRTGPCGSSRQRHRGSSKTCSSGVRPGSRPTGRYPARQAALDTLGTPSAQLISKLATGIGAVGLVAMRSFPSIRRAAVPCLVVVVPLALFSPAINQVDRLRCCPSETHRL